MPGLPKHPVSGSSDLPQSKSEGGSGGGVDGGGVETSMLDMLDDDEHRLGDGET